MKCVLLHCWDQKSQDICAATGQLLKILIMVIGHRVDMLNVASTGMFTILASILNLKR